MTETEIDNAPYSRAISVRKTESVMGRINSLVRAANKMGLNGHQILGIEGPFAGDDADLYLLKYGTTVMKVKPEDQGGG